MSKDKLGEIKKHWEQMAAVPTDESGLKPTARDPYLQEVVETAMERHLYAGARLLDLGCGDGRSTLRFARTTGDVLGVDYVEEFVRKARDHAKQLSQGKVAFEQADVLDLGPIRRSYGLFDIVTSIRCLINLPTWTQQAAALQQIAQVVRPGGLFLASEGWQEGFDGLNIYRQRVQLPRMAVAAYNCLISRLDFEAEVRQYFEIIGFINLGLYLFVSRLVQPLLTRPESPSHVHPLNKIAAEIVNANVASDSFEHCDYSGVYVLRRK